MYQLPTVGTHRQLYPVYVGIEKIEGNVRDAHGREHDIEAHVPSASMFDHVAQLVPASCELRVASVCDG